jgi:hypothetical protein
MKVIFETMLERLDKIKYQADIDGKVIRRIEMNRGEAAEFKGDIMRMMGPAAIDLIGEFLKPLPFEGLIGAYNGMEVYIVKAQ